MSFERNVAFVVLHTVFFVYDISADTECLFSLSIDKKEITTANKYRINPNKEYSSSFV